MGKNFSCDNTGKRNKSDFYQTPYSMTQKFVDEYLLDSVLPGEVIWEPACGHGAISKVLLDNFPDNKLLQTDVISGNDFFDMDYTPDWIVTNPPFSIANEFLDKALDDAQRGVAMLLPLNYLQSHTRYKMFFEKFPPNYIYVYTRMPMLSDAVRNDGKFETGMQSYAWYVWDVKATNTATILYWLDVNEFVAGKNEPDQ